MAVKLTIPGEPRVETSEPIGPYSELLDLEVRADTAVRTSRAARGEDVTADAEDDDLLELTWQGGIIELVRADQVANQVPGATRASGSAIRIPTHRQIRTAERTTRDVELEGVKHVRLRGVGSELLDTAAGWAVPKVVKAIEARKTPEPGLYHVDRDGNLTEPARNLRAGTSPYLVLLHGTFSSTAGSFGELFNAPGDWVRLRDAYDGRIVALEHHSVSESPAGNALQVISAFGGAAKMHFLSHSRGGLIGDLICRHPFEGRSLEQFFREAQYGFVREQLDELNDRMRNRNIEVQRFARVAAPVAGTLLASERFDNYLNVILSLLGRLPVPGAHLFDFVKAIASAIVATRTRADQLPGIESMMPHSDKGFVPFLNLATPRGNDLAVIAGDVRGGGIFDRIKDFFSYLYYREDNDFVVDSKSMFRGVPRKSARGFYYRAPKADHFSYFEQDETRSRIIEWLADGDDSGYETLNAAVPYGGLRGARAAERSQTRAIPSLATIEKQRDDSKPVVFMLPGIMGTHLSHRGDRTWIHILRLAWGGIQDLGIKRRRVRPDGLVEMVYEPLYDYLTDHYHVIPFGFDWRLPIAASAEQLAKAVQAELKAHDRPVRLIAHSMGGLVSRAMAAFHAETWERMKERGGRLVMLGTPNFGSYTPVEVFVQKHDMVKKLAIADLRSTLDEITDVVRAFPGLVEMLPHHEQSNLFSLTQWGAASDQAPDGELLKKSLAFREQLDTRAIEPDSMMYVAGHAERTAARMVVERKDDRVKVHFGYTRQGDGTVPWKLGIMPGLDTYYVEAEHGQIPAHEASFDGFRELLDTGRTSKLSEIAPSARRGADDEIFEIDTRDEDDRLRYYPDESDLIQTFAGVSAELAPEPMISLSIVNGDVRDATSPVIVGHYRGDPIVSVESLLDRAAAGGAMVRDHRLGQYPGPLGTARIYPTSNDSFQVIVAGLGDPGTLTRIGLEAAYRAAIMEFALRSLQSAGEGFVSLTIGSLLVGSYGGRVTIEESVAAFVDAAFGVNQDLAAQKLDGQVRIDALEILEIYQDVAIEAAHAARRVQSRRATRLVVDPTVDHRDTARRSRPYSPYQSGWNRRIRVHATDKEIKFEVTTDLARSEPFTRPVQWSLVDSLISDTQVSGNDAAKTLFRYLLPYQFAGEASNLSDVVLDLNPKAARIPWELLDESNEAQAPTGVRVSTLRTLSTVTRRESPRRSGERRALVIGEPAGVEPSLPGAREEAESVAELLGDYGLTVNARIDEEPKAILTSLYSNEYDIVHIAAHGEYNEDPDLPADEQLPSGVVLADGRYLRAAEFANLAAVPSIVFLNCCHLGKLGGDLSEDAVTPTLRHPGQFAASLAQTLIEMGVGVVVVAGWAVSDEPAKTFAERFYTELLSGADLSSAVGTARYATFDSCERGDVTWGAFQVYGDPGFVLHWPGQRTRTRASSAPTFVSPSELSEYVSNYRSRGRGADADRRLRYRNELVELESDINQAWRDHGSIWDAFGAAYAELGYYQDAHSAYQTAIQTSDAPIQAIEQLANMESKLATSTDNDNDAVDLLESSITRLEALCEVAPSSERFSLIGASYKRLAHVGRAKVTPLRDARRAYERAIAMEPANLYYPLENKIVLDFVIDGEYDADDLQRVRTSAAQSTDSWAVLSLAQTEVLAVLGGGGNVESVTRAFVDTVLSRGVSQRELQSALEQIRFVEAMARSAAVSRRAARIVKLIDENLEAR
ncbi:MAG: CHAT domain-containing protein [Pseudomonadota bacterium]